jgi:hypothetical protein
MTTLDVSTSLEPEFADLEPRPIRFEDHEWSTSALELQITELGLPMAAARVEALVTIDVDTDRGSVRLPFPMRIEPHPDARGSVSYEVSGSLYHLTITFQLSRYGAIHWRLEAGGHDAASRAAVLDLLVAMSGSGSVVLWDDEDNALLRISLEASTLDQSLLEERQFLTDLLVVEAWSGQRLPLPDSPDDRSLSDLTQVVHWIREREMRVRFTSPIVVVSDRPSEKADELRLHKDFSWQLFGVWVQLGQLSYRVKVEVLSSKREGVTWRSEYRSRDEWITATLAAPRRGRLKAAKEAEEGRLPRRPASRETLSRTRAREAADALIAEWDQEKGPVDEAIRDEVRRGWLL